MRKLLIAVIFLGLLPAAALATAQAPDVIHYEGKQYKLFANPLESFFKRGERPKFHIGPGSMSTANWRGYVATWKVEEDMLYLVGLDSWVCKDLRPENCKRADLRELFGEKYRDGKVRADWFTGDLRLPDGERLRYVHMGYGSIYERDIILTVAAGRITGRQVINNTGKKHPSSLDLERQELEKMKPKEKGEN
ncbi:MAG TPA: hypothetical protein VD861_06480 [Pyrinomonadaceae bacterium]|nr:hypothetical protein [Pyrinomonadaceae bacterium]